MGTVHSCLGHPGVGRGKLAKVNGAVGDQIRSAEEDAKRSSVLQQVPGTATGVLDPRHKQFATTAGSDKCAKQDPREELTAAAVSKSSPSRSQGSSSLRRAANGAFAATSLEDIAPEIAPALGLPYQVHACGPPVPPCDSERLQTVRALNAVTPMLDPALLEAPPDPELNTILKLVASIFQAPATLVALFDDKRIFIRDSEGAFQRGDFPWRWSFCGWTMASKNDQIMVIPDATKDARFCQNYAVQELGVQFYCGSPLIASNGHRLGTLCFADFKPRPFDATSAHILNNLSELVVRHLEKDIALQMRQHSNTALTEAYCNLRRTIDCFEHCVALVDTAVPGWRLVYTNLTWNKTAGVERERMQGALISDVFSHVAGSPVPGPVHLRHARAAEEFSISGVRLKLPASGSSGGSGSNSMRISSGPVLYNLKFRAASKTDMDEDVQPIGIPSNIPRGDAANDAKTGADQLYFVTMEDATKALALARNSSSSSWASLDTPDAIAGLKMGLLLGKGGYGSVYHATLFGTQVAVKILQQDVALPPDGSMPAPPTEALLSQELRHPHIVATLKCASRRLHYHASASACCGSTEGDARWARVSDPSDVPPSSTVLAVSGGARSGGSGLGSAGEGCNPLSPFVQPHTSPSRGGRGAGRGSHSHGKRSSSQGWAVFSMADVQEGAVEGEDDASIEDLEQSPRSAGSSGKPRLQPGVQQQQQQQQADEVTHAPHGAVSSVVSDMDWPGTDSACMMDPVSAPVKVPPSARFAARPSLDAASHCGGPPSDPFARPSTARSSSTTGFGSEVLPMVPMQTWIVMEYCDKSCLQDAVDRGWLRFCRRTGVNPAVGPGSEANMRGVLATAREIASALSFLHARGIVHGDLSAWNVMLCTTGAGANDGARGWTAKVADFGLSRQMDVRTRIKTQTYGTLTHMPPESLRDGVVSKAVDVYSFGVLLWQMYTGSRPWAGLSHGQIIYMVAAQSAKLQLPRGTPAAFAELTLSCMAGDAAQRPTFDAIVAAVEAMIDGLARGHDLPKDMA